MDLVPEPDSLLPFVPNSDCDISSRNLMAHITQKAPICSRSILGNLVSSYDPVGNGTELDTVGRQFELYLWRPCGATCYSSRTVVVMKLLRTSAL